MIDDVVAPSRSRASRDRARRVLLVTAVGLATGALTLVGQATLDGDAHRLANSGAVWLTVAFATGASMSCDREAVLAGIGTLLLALLGYQLAATVAAVSVSVPGLLIWSVTALVGGPLFGLAGRHWRAGTGRARALAIAILGAAFVAEGVYTLGSIERLAGAGWTEVAVGLGLCLLLARDRLERVTAIPLLVPLSLAGYLAFVVISRLSRLA
jgi:hypothetical protein